jgi:hypothetical protein
VLRRKEPPVSREELRGALLLLMNIDENVERIRREIVEDDGEEEKRR